MSDLTAVSLFDGIGGIHLALKRAGVRVVAGVEIDPACRGVLARHFPGAVLFNDVRQVTGDQLRAAGFVPRRGILAGGWPCTGNSIAGRREGMADPRSGLWVHVARLLAELRPRWFLGENVPGLYSVNDRRDIAIVRSDLAQLGYWWAERTLDAQHFGVPQRRARVFFAGCLGERAAPVQVLFEPESGAGDSAPGRQARQGAAGGAANGPGSPRTVGTLGGNGPGGGWRVGADEAAAGQLVANTAYTVHGVNSNAEQCHAFEADVARCLDTMGGFAPNQGGTVIASTLQGGGRRGHRVDAEGAAGGHLVPAAPLPSREVIACDTSREGKGADSDATSGVIAVPVALRGRDGGSNAEVGEPGDPAFALRTPAGGSSFPMVAHTLTGEGFDASEDGTGRGIPIVPMGMPPVASPLTSGSATGDGVNPPGRRQEDDTNLVAMAYADSFLSANRYDSAYATGHQTGPGEVLRVLREAHGSEAVSLWCAGVAASLQPPEVLRPLVHGQGIRCPASEGKPHLGDSALAFAEDDPAGSVCLVWQAGRERRAPQEWRLDGQLAGELGAYLSQLSHQGAPWAAHLRDLWGAAQSAGLLREALPALQGNGRPGESADPPAEDVHGLRGSSALALTLREALHASEAGGDAASEIKGGGGVGMAVRRLTPRLRECERLQGFPDGWTRYLADGTEQSDSARYRQCGNSVAVPVVEWLAHRIVAVDAALVESEAVT